MNLSAVKRQAKPAQIVSISHGPTLTDQTQLVWFLTPTVVLGDQHLGVLKSQMPGVQMRSLTGSDNVDAWSNQETWDAALLNIRVVVSTYQILFDALAHAFVTLDLLSLIVFDEGIYKQGDHFTSPRG